MTLSHDEIEYYVRILREIVQESERAGRPALGSWVKNQLLLRQPDFAEKRWGYSTFKSFVADIPNITCHHDGIDIVIGISANTQPQPRPTQASFNHLGSVQRDLWRAFCRPPATPSAFLDRTALQRGVIHVEHGSPISEEHEQKLREDTLRYLEIPHSNIDLQTTWLKDWTTTYVEDPERANILTILATEDGLRRTGQELRKLGREREWFRYRAAKTQERLRDWARENHLPWERPIVVFEKEQTNSVMPDPNEGGITQRTFRQFSHHVLNHVPESQLRELMVPLGAVWDALIAHEDS